MLQNSYARVVPVATHADNPGAQKTKDEMSRCHTEQLVTRSTEGEEFPVECNYLDPAGCFGVTVHPHFLYHGRVVGSAHEREGRSAGSDLMG